MGSASQSRVYIAGPDVFLADAAALARRKKELCARHGLVGLHPLDNEMEALACPVDTARAIYAGNRAMMLAADAIVANLTPFRGPSADPGTVFEVGHMAGLGRPCFGYTLDSATYAARVTADGAAVEDFGLHDNLMIDCALLAFVVPAVPFGSDAEGHLWCFERCLEAVAVHLARRDEGWSPTVATG